MIPSRYLGDAVYATYDGYHIQLTTNSHLLKDASAVIYLEPAVLDALVRYAEDVKKELQCANQNS